MPDATPFVGPPVLVGSLQGRVGPVGPPGNAVASGQWQYRPGTTTPTVGEISWAPSSLILGGPVEVWRHRTDFAGVVWAADAVISDYLVVRDALRNGFVAILGAVDGGVDPDGISHYAGSITQLGVIPADQQLMQVSRVLAPIPGPPGPAGPAGSDPGAQSFRFIQPTASATWIITHSLGFRPSVTVVDSAGTVCIPGTLTYPSDSQVVLLFSAAFAGEAYLS